MEIETQPVTTELRLASLAEIIQVAAPAKKISPWLIGILSFIAGGIIVGLIVHGRRDNKESKDKK